MKKGMLTADKMVLDATTDIFDLRRLRDYFVRVLGDHVPGENKVDEWWTLLLHLRLATTSHEQMAATIDGMLLFGKNPKRFLPQSGIRAICYSGASSAHAVRADEYLKGPLVPLCAQDGSLVESGLVDQAWDFVRRNTTPKSNLEGTRRIDRGEYPEGMRKKIILGMVAHNDTEPDLIEEERRFTVRLWKERSTV